MLFDLVKDPDEFTDLGRDPGHADIIAMMYGHLHHWARRQSQRVTRSADQLADMRGASQRKGIILGAYDESDITPDLMARYIGPAEKDFTGDT